MKTLLIGLLALGSLSVFADQKVHSEADSQVYCYCPAGNEQLERFFLHRQALVNNQVVDQIIARYYSRAECEAAIYQHPLCRGY